MTAALFAELVHDQLVDLAQLPSSAEEGAALSRAPLALAPPAPRSRDAVDERERLRRERARRRCAAHDVRGVRATGAPASRRSARCGTPVIDCGGSAP